MRMILRFFCLCPVLAAGVTAFGFMPNPDMLTFAPAMARAGTTFEVSVSGKDLEGATSLRFSHAAIQAEPVLLPADEFHPAPRPVAGKFLVTIPDLVEPGVYEVRSLGYFGLSTARPFVVFPSGSTEAVESGDHSSPETALPLDVEQGMLGTIDAGKFDWYRFSGKAGERVLLEVLAERLDSKSDVLLAVFDGEGRELESSRHHFGRDPFVDFTPPSDGEYFISLSDVLFVGGREFFYHLRLSRGPHVDFAFPPAGEPGKNRPFTLFGRNLPGGSLGGSHLLQGKPLETVEVQLDVPSAPSVPATFYPGVPRAGMVPAFEYSLEGANPVRIGFATAPVVEEMPSDGIQTVAVPAEIAGRFDEPGDRDHYQVALKKGTTYWIDVLCHRLGVVADPFVKLERISRDESGAETYTQVAENDDLPSFYGRDSLDDLNADSLDPALSYTPDSDGDYRLTLINQSGGGSVAHLYRLAVREASHDFQLITGTELTKTINNDAFPAAPLLRRGGSMIYRVVAFRRDGFEGEITVTAQGLPPGVVAKPLVLSGKTSQGFLTAHAAPDAAAWAGPITISGSAKVGDRDLVREARPASLVWGKRVFGNQAQVRSRLDMETVLSVMDTEAEPTRIEVDEERVWSAEIGQTLEIPLKLIEAGTRSGGLVLNVHGFPGLYRSPPAITVGEKDTEAVLKLDLTPSGNFALVPGKYQFVLQGIGNAKYRQNPAAAEAAAAELKRINDLRLEFAKLLEVEKTAVMETEKTLGEIRQREASAADDSARAALKGEVDAAQSGLDEAKKMLEASEARLVQLDKVEERAVKAAADAEAKAKERSNQFATYSHPLTVEVKPISESK